MLAVTSALIYPCVVTQGLTFTPDDAGCMSIMMQNWPASNSQVVVVTDGSRILGLGDLGANGMGIPIGKLALYCAYGGIAPHRVLPVLLDFGTNNEVCCTIRFCPCAKRAHAKPQRNGLLRPSLDRHAL